MNFENITSSAICLAAATIFAAQAQPLAAQGTPEFSYDVSHSITTDTGLYYEALTPYHIQGQTQNSINLPPSLPIASSSSFAFSFKVGQAPAIAGASSAGGVSSPGGCSIYCAADIRGPQEVRAAGTTTSISLFATKNIDHEVTWQSSGESQNSAAQGGSTFESTFGVVESSDGRDYMVTDMPFALNLAADLNWSLNSIGTATQDVTGSVKDIVRIYSDLNGNGLVDGMDMLLHEGMNNSSGQFSLSAGQFVLRSMWSATSEINGLQIRPCGSNGTLKGNFTNRRLLSVTL